MINLVTHSIPALDFQKTNGPWNALRLNAPWSIGYTTGLLLSREFTSYLDWQAYYFETGEKRNKLLSALPLTVQKEANGLADTPIDRRNIAYKYPQLDKINKNYGRTKIQLLDKGTILHNYLVKINIPIEPRYCTQAVYYRVLGETWNGVIREKQCFDQIQLLLPQVRIQKVDPSFDHTYAVDGLLYRDQELLFGVQIKPNSYMSTKPYILKARRSNVRKNEKFTKKYKVPVLDLYYDHQGRIHENQLHYLRQKIS